MRLYKRVCSNGIVEYYVVHRLGEHFWWWGSGLGGSWQVSIDTWDICCATSESMIEVKPLEVLLVTGMESPKDSPYCPRYECRCNKGALVREV